jgi:hypothetical protein
MGYLAHRALIVTGDHKQIVEAHAKAVELCSDLVSSIVPGRVNGDSSFMVAPDCSKEGWADSERGDEERTAMTEWLESTRQRLWLDWVVVRFGGDDPELAKIETTSVWLDEDA